MKERRSAASIFTLASTVDQGQNIRRENDRTQDEEAAVDKLRQKSVADVISADPPHAISADECDESDTISAAKSDSLIQSRKSSCTSGGSSLRRRGPRLSNMSGNILELELRDSRELSASQLHLLLHPTQEEEDEQLRSSDDLMCLNIGGKRHWVSHGFTVKRIFG